MPPVIIPAPPGEAVGFADSVPARIAPPSTANLFVAGVFEEGDVAQVSDIGSLRTAFGARTSSSVALDESAAALAEGGGTLTASRVLGPEPVRATVTLDSKVTVTAKTPGAWGNTLTAEAEVPETGKSRITIKRDGISVAVTPVFSTLADLLAWESDVVDLGSIAPGLPAATAAQPLATGTDDRANITPDDWAAAFAKLDPRYGPGFLFLPGVTDLAVHGKAIEHLAATNRIGFAQLPLDVTESQALAHAQALYADYPEDAWRMGLFASWAYSTPVSGEPERLVGYAGIQAGIASRVEQRYGFGPAPFGLRRGQPTTVSLLEREWSTGHTPPGEVQRLYAGRVNAAVDNGTAITLKGYRTLDPDPIREDLHVAGTRMRLAFMAHQEAEELGGEPSDRSTVASFVGRLDGRCKRDFADARAFNTDGDAGFRVDGDSVNTVASLARRELHALIRFRPNGSTHWADVLVGAARPNEQI
jgi:hypothetical protein